MKTGGRIAAAVGLVAGALFAYAPALRGDWLWDDGLEVFLNPSIRDRWGFWKVWTEPRGLDYLPLKDFFLWIEWHLWGRETGPYHAVNLALHLMSAFLIWKILGKLGVACAWVGGVLFALHPLAVESVAWIAEFKNVLSLPFLLLSFSAFIDWDGSPLERRSRKAYWASLAWFAAAMLSKESVVMAPVILLAYLLWKRSRIAQSDLIAVGPFFGVSVALGITALEFQWHRAMHAAEAMPGAGSRFAQAGTNLAAYLFSSVVPLGLSPVYVASPAWVGLLAWLGLASLALAIALRWRKAWARATLFGLAWFFLNLAPAVGIVGIAYLRVGPRADHLAYLPLVGLVGLAAALASALSKLPRGAGWRRPDRVPWAVALLAIGFACLSRAYAARFADDRSLWTAAVEETPGSWLARNNLGRDLFQAGLPSEAVVQLRLAEGLRSDSGEVHANLGAVLEDMKRYPEAEVEFRKAIDVEPDYAPFRYDFGKCLLVEGNPRAAEVEFREAIRLDPALAEAHNNLGISLVRQGRSQEAIAEYRAALACEPGFPEALVNLGNVAFRDGDLKTAETRYREALTNDPKYAPAHLNLSQLLNRQGKTAEAAAEMRAAKGP